MRIDRMMAIIIILLNRKRITAKELAQKFEVSLRTIYRDIDAVNLAGIPIVSHQGNEGGFSILENYKLDRQLLSLDDFTSILSTLKSVNNTFENDKLDNAIEKITNLVPKDKSNEINENLEQVIIDILPWSYNDKKKDALKTIKNAVQNNRLISFYYNSNKGESIKRDIEPMTLVFKGYDWYLFGYCLLRADYRIFRVSRMEKIEILEENFIKKEVSYFNFSKNENKEISKTLFKIKYAKKAAYLLKDYFEDDKLEKLENGDIIATFEAPLDEWIFSMVLSQHENVELLEPAFLREQIKEKLEKVLKKYQT